MAIIGDIRKKGFLIALVVGGALLAFILGDFLAPGGSSQLYDIGEVSGELIPAQSFELKVQEAIENYKEQSQQTSVDQATIDLIRQQTWSQLLNEIVMGNEYKEVGVAVHSDEIYDLVTGANPHPSIVQAFSDPQTGLFNSGNVINFLKNMDNDPTGKSLTQWLPFEKAITKDQLAKKYYNLIKKGLYVTRKEAKNDYDAKNGTRTCRYVLQRYSDIADSAMNVTESDIEKYYKEHKSEYEQEASRSIEYVSFDVIPSPDDTLIIADWIGRIKEDIAPIEELEELSSFVNMNADTRYRDVFVTKGTLSATIDSIMFNSDTGYVHGPYIEFEAYNVTKLVALDMRPDSVEARHILIEFSGNGDSVHIETADSLLTVIKEGGGDFATLATTLSKDPGSAANGGDVGWFTEGTMVKPFNDSCFTGEVGDLMVVPSQFGAHLIEILDMTEPVKKVKVATIDRKIDPSSKTFAAVYADANRFAGTNTTKEKFNQAAADLSLVTRVSENLKIGDKTIIGLETPREMIRWAYNVEQGAVSRPFELGNKFVIAVLTAVKEEGYSTLEQIRTQMEIGTMNEKKAAYIATKIAENGDENIDDLAHNLSANNDDFDLRVEKVDLLSFSSFNLPGVGREPELIGEIFGFPVSKLSSTIKGNAGVFIFIVDEINEAPAVEDFSANQLRMSNDSRARVDYEVLEALTKKADVVDNRHLFY